MPDKRYPPRIERICGLGLPRMKRLLDIGGGDGKYAFAFKNAFRVEELYGVDMSVGAVRIGNAGGIKMSCTDLNHSKLPYVDSFFDIVFAGEIIEHLLSPDGLMDEVKRVLKPGGYFILTTPNIANWCDRCLLLFGWQPYSIPTHSKYRGLGTFMSKARNTMTRDHRYVFTTGGCGLPHIQFFTSKSLRALFEEYSFEVLKMWGASSDQFTFPINKVARKVLIGIDEMISPVCASLASELVVVAKNGYCEKDI